jgi:hypothetical protein
LFDIKKYRSLHEVILSDNGVPGLDKKGYSIPDPELIERKLENVEKDMSIDDDEEFYLSA